MENSIIVENLSKNYSENKAVENINFKIAENEIVGLLGPNGCGKTTTIAMILGLLKPSNGEIIIDGLNIENNRIKLLHKMNFISPYIELPKKLTVKENFIVYARLYSVKNINERISYLSETLRLNDFLNKNKFLMSDYMSLVDIAIFPFIRQFFNVDNTWLIDEHPFIYNWLDDLLQSKLFLSVMNKYEENKDESLIVNFNCK